MDELIYKEALKAWADRLSIGSKFNRNHKIDTQCTLLVNSMT